MVHFVEIIQAPPPPLKLATPKLVSRNCLRYLQTTLIMGGGELVSEFMWGIVDEERIEVRSQVKRSEGGDPLVRLHLHRLLIPRALRVRKKTKEPGGSILYRMKINLNEISRLSLHLMQTHSLRNTSQRKVFTTQSVKFIPRQTT